MGVLLLKILIGTTRAFGLLPMRISFQPLHAAPSQLAYAQSLAYLLIFGPLMVVCLCIYLWLKFWTLQATATTSTFMFAVSLAWMMGVLRSVCMYAVQMYRRDSLVALFNEALRIRCMFEVSYGALYADVPFLDGKCRQLVRWKIGSLVLQFGFVGVAMYYYEMGTYASLAVRMLVKLAILIGTDVVMLVYSAGHFAVTLVALQFFRAINARLSESVAVVRELLLTRRQSDVKMRLHSNVTEDIDRIAFLYDQVSAYAHRLNGVFGFPVVVTLMNSFLYTLVALYNLVHDIGKLVDFEADDQPPQVMFNCFFFAYFAMQVYFMVWISDAVIEEANKTGRILCRTASFQIDKPTKECIEIFSLSILQAKKLLSACGMFQVDKTLVYGMVGALTSYLTILIQFDLAGSKSTATTSTGSASNGTNSPNSTNITLS